MNAYPKAILLASLCIASAWPKGRGGRGPAVKVPALQDPQAFQDLRIPPLLEGKSLILTLSKATKTFFPDCHTNTYGYNGETFW
jgi:hypothetical protein